MSQTVGQQLIITAIPALPALVFLVLALFGRYIGEGAQFVAIFGVATSLVFSCFALFFVAPRRAADRLRGQLDRLRRGRLFPDGDLHRRPRGGDARRGLLREPHDPTLLRGVYAGRQALRLVLRGLEPLYRLDARPRRGAELHRAVRVLGARRPVFVSPDRALVREA